MTGLRSSLCAMLIFGAALPASAQHKSSEFETVSLAVYGPCNRATFTDVATATQGEAACIKLLSDMDVVKQAAGANVTAHDMNIFHLLKSAGALRVGRAYLMLDNNVRTARVCQRAEEAWTHGAMVDVTASPAEYTNLMKPMLTDAAGLARTCRAEFGTPAGAAALP